MTLMDSSGWLEYFMNGPLIERYVAYFNKPGELCTPTIVIYEVYRKLKRELNEEQALHAAAQMAKTRVVPLTDAIALEAADLSLDHKLPMADAIVYATALSRNARLVTSDADFKNLPHVTYFESKPEY